MNFHGKNGANYKIGLLWFSILTSEIQVNVARVARIVTKWDFFYGFSTIVHRHHLSCNAIIFKPWCSWCFLLTILLTLLVVSVAITFFPCQMNQRWKKTWHYGISCKSQIRLFSKSKTNLFMSWGIFNERKRDVIAWQIIPFRFLEALTRLAGKDSDGHFCSRASYYISFIDGPASNLTAIRVWWGKDASYLYNHFWELDLSNFEVKPWLQKMLKLTYQPQRPRRPGWIA